MPFEKLTRLQFLVLGILMENERPGEFIREKLKKLREAKSLPAFYQLMSRLEKAKLVKGWYVKQTIDDQTITERHYRITGHGTRCWEHDRESLGWVSDLAANGGWANV